MGVQGKRLREFIKVGHRASVRNGTSYWFTYTESMIPPIFCKELVALGDSVEFLYLRTFADSILYESLSHSSAFVVDWFEGDGEAPMNNFDRQKVETGMMQLMNDGVRIYAFSRKLRTQSTWWTENFREAVADYMQRVDLTKGDSDGDKPNGSTVSFSRNTGQGQGVRPKNSRVNIR